MTTKQHKVVGTHFKSRYGISNNEVKEMLTQQGNVCAICGSGNIPLQVDHSHSSGKVRGMLCAKCNRGLGLFYDNQKFLRKAREYLIRWNDKTTRIGGLL